jgi:hypothetical protein
VRIHWIARLTKNGRAISTRGSGPRSALLDPHRVR